MERTLNVEWGRQKLGDWRLANTKLVTKSFSHLLFIFGVQWRNEIKQNPHLFSFTFYFGHFCKLVCMFSNSFRARFILAISAISKKLEVHIKFRIENTLILQLVSTTETLRKLPTTLHDQYQSKEVICTLFFNSEIGFAGWNVELNNSKNPWN